MTDTPISSHAVVVTIGKALESLVNDGGRFSDSLHGAMDTQSEMITQLYKLFSNERFIDYFRSIEMSPDNNQYLDQIGKCAYFNLHEYDVIVLSPKDKSFEQFVIVRDKDKNKVNIYYNGNAVQTNNGSKISLYLERPIKELNIKTNTYRLISQKELIGVKATEAAGRNSLPQLFYDSCVNLFNEASAAREVAQDMVEGRQTQYAEDVTGIKGALEKLMRKQ